MLAHLFRHSRWDRIRNDSIHPFGSSLAHRLIIDALQQVKQAQVYRNIAVILIYTTKSGIMVNILKSNWGFHYASRGNEEYLL